MSMVAIFETPCCKRKLVFGRFRGDEMYPPEIMCCEKRRKITWKTYISEQHLGIKYTKPFFLNDEQLKKLG